ncbi:DNA topoisomerase I [Candidatus Thiodiazotropha endoloripes]|nr:DNA topoisomerase I [Candidatus Thiodiazotropha endoloripes]
MKHLMIVESPNKCKKIQSILGSDWIVKASMGHVRDLPPKEMGVDFETFQPNYVPSKKGKAVLSGLRKLTRAVDRVWLATDPDREGEAIAWHLQQALNLKHPHRVSFNAITKSSVTDSVNYPSVIDMSLVRAQEGRRVLDRLVGYSVSPELSRACGNGVWLTAGRVQSVALRIVAERELELLNFKPKNYVEVYLHFNTDNIRWKAKWIPGDLLPELERYWTNREFALQVADITNVSVTYIDRSKKSNRPPPPFITSTLQQAASVTLKISPKQCMQSAQKLFESGLITYHRTDNPNLSDEGTTEVRCWLQSNGYTDHVSTQVNTWKSKTNAQEGHEAIRPTSISKLPDGNQDIPQDLQNLYKLIWQRAVACQMKNAVLDVTKISLSSNDTIDGNIMRFDAKGEQLIYSGWRSFSGRDAADESVVDDGQQLPQLNPYQQLCAIDGAVEDKQTKPLNRYTEASLIKKLEAEGVGRPSTYASIIDNIVHRKYVSIAKRKLHATDLGILIVRTLVDRFSFLELKYTSQIEALLDQVAAGKMEYFDVVSTAYRVLTNELGSLSKLGAQNEVKFTCPECGKALRLIKNQFWGCSGYPDCGYTAPNDKGKPGVPRPRKKSNGVDKSYPCDCGKGFLQRRKSKTGFFWGCSNYPKCKHTLPDCDGKPDERQPKSSSQSKVIQVAGEACQTCKAGTVVLRTIKNGKNAGEMFYGCTSFPKCQHFTWAKE